MVGSPVRLPTGRSPRTSPSEDPAAGVPVVAAFETEAGVSATAVFGVTTAGVVPSAGTVGAPAVVSEAPEGDVGDDVASEDPPVPDDPVAPPVDAVSAFPDVVGESVVPPHAGGQPAPLQTEPPALFEDPPTLFDEVTSEHAEYQLPDAGVLRISPEHGDDSGETAARVAELLVQTLAHFGVEATVIGQISGPRVTRYELQLAPGTKVGKVAGCRVTDGTVERGANVRLIRDNVVVHEGKLSTLKRFKDEVKEVQSGQECGMAFENYSDMRVGDIIECYRVESIQRSL